MKIDNIEPWILAGYELFANEGPKGLKVETISKKVKISKSSFYHHFVDLDIFTDILLSYHLDRTKIVAEKERRCKSIDPELINILLEFKLDLLFNRQLRINRANVKFRDCFELSNQLSEMAIMEVWAKDLGLLDKSKLVKILFSIVIDNFYLQITKETLNYDWLSEYFKNLRKLTIELKNHNESS